MFYDQRTYYHSCLGCRTTLVCAHLPAVALTQCIPRNTLCQLYPSVIRIQLVLKWPVKFAQGDLLATRFAYHRCKAFCLLSLFSLHLFYQLSLFSSNNQSPILFQQALLNAIIAPCSAEKCERERVALPMKQLVMHYFLVYLVLILSNLLSTLKSSRTLKILRRLIPVCCGNSCLAPLFRTNS